MKKNRIEIGKYYKGVYSSVIVRATSDEHQNGFSGVVVVQNDSVFPVGFEETGWDTINFVEIDYKGEEQSSNELFPIY